MHLFNFIAQSRKSPTARNVHVIDKVVRGKPLGEGSLPYNQAHYKLMVVIRVISVNPCFRIVGELAVVSHAVSWAKLL